MEGHPRDEALRIALLTYRGNPYSGGQGVYIRHLSAALVRLGHAVTVVSGQPYPELEPGVDLVRLPSLDLYRPEDPFRRDRPIAGTIDLFEQAMMYTGSFPEPLTFTLRARRWLRPRTGFFDVLHDNQCLGYGVLAMARSLPVLSTIHHPITVDRRLDLAHADGPLRRLSVRRWYGFHRMQIRVARRLPKHITVSEASRGDIVREMGIDPGRIDVVPVGVDPAVFRPRPEAPKIPGRILTIASADGPLKGVTVLLEALAKVRAGRPDAHLVLVGPARDDGPARRAVRRFEVSGAVTFAGNVDHDRLAELYAGAEVAVVPSLYEGFSLPAVQAMACGLPLVATSGGALPEVAGPDGGAALLVAPGDADALAVAVQRVLDDAELRARLGAAGRERVLRRFTWEATAASTVERYRELVARHPGC